MKYNFSLKLFRINQRICSRLIAASTFGKLESGSPIRHPTFRLTTAIEQSFSSCCWPASVRRCICHRSVRTPYNEQVFFVGCLYHEILTGEAHDQPNKWIYYFTSADNRHALPLFTSLLNLVCAYDPVGYGLPYNHLLFSDSREPLVEIALQVLIVTLDHNCSRDPDDDVFIRPFLFVEDNAFAYQYFAFRVQTRITCS